MSKSTLKLKEYQLKLNLDKLSTSRISGQEKRRIGRLVNRLLEELKRFLDPSTWNSYAKWAFSVVGITLASFSAQGQSFQPPVLGGMNLPNTASNYAYQAIPADLDGDGDLDVMFSDPYYGKINILENVGTPTNPMYQEADSFKLTPSFGPLIAIGDMDGDGDMDMVGIHFAGSYGGVFTYSENTGSSLNFQPGNFTQGFFGLDSLAGIVSPTSAFYASTPSLTDLDGDGDLDLLIGTLEYSRVTYAYSPGFIYFENTGSPSTPLFGAPFQRNPFGLNPAFLGDTIGYPLPAHGDFDFDGDIDFIVNDYENNRNVYFENTGSAINPQFTAQDGSSIGLISPSFYTFYGVGDLDADGDLDLVYTSFYDDPTGVFTVENRDIFIGLEEVNQAFSLYPNPSNGILNLDFKGEQGQIQVLNGLGQTVLHFDQVQNRINLQGLPSGTYFLRFTSASGKTFSQSFIRSDF